MYCKVISLLFVTSISTTIIHKRTVQKTEANPFSSFGNNLKNTGRDVFNTPRDLLGANTKRNETDETTTEVNKSKRKSNQSDDDDSSSRGRRNNMSNQGQGNDNQNSYLQSPNFDPTLSNLLSYINQSQNPNLNTIDNNVQNSNELPNQDKMVVSSVINYLNSSPNPNYNMVSGNIVNQNQVSSATKQFLLYLISFLQNQKSNNIQSQTNYGSGYSVNDVQYVTNTLNAYVNSRSNPNPDDIVRIIQSSNSLTTGDKQIISYAITNSANGSAADVNNAKNLVLSLNQVSSDLKKSIIDVLNKLYQNKQSLSIPYSTQTTASGSVSTYPQSWYSSGKEPSYCHFDRESGLSLISFNLCY